MKKYLNGYDQNETELNEEKKKVKEVRGKNEGKQMLSVWIGFKWFSMKWNKNTKVGMKNKWMR